MKAERKICRKCKYLLSNYNKKFEELCLLVDYLMKMENPPEDEVPENCPYILEHTLVNGQQEKLND